MAKIKNNNNKNKRTATLILFIIILILLILLILLKKQSNINIVPSSQNAVKFQSQNTKSISNLSELNTYHSKSLKITIDIPKKFKVEEKYNDIIIRNINIDGDIIIGSIGTNYDNLEDYIDYHIKINNQAFVSKQVFNLKNLSGIKGIIRHPNNKNADTLIYYFYPEPWTIITISTTSPELYSDLDQVARSFRYEP